MTTPSDRVITGNYFNKHEARNPLYRYLMRRYRKALQKLISEVNPDSAFEVGSGEGYIAHYAHEVLPNLRFYASDIDISLMSEIIVNNARTSWCLVSADAVPVADRVVDLALACEVLEHLPNPDLALQEINRISKRWVIASVPNEPWWRLLNLARLKYVRELGNTPGHINHWSSIGIRNLMDRHMRVIRIESVFPWIFILAETRK